MRAWNSAIVLGWFGCTLFAVSIAAAQGGPAGKPAPKQGAPQGSASEPIPPLPTPGAPSQPQSAASATPSLPPVAASQPAPAPAPQAVPTASAPAATPLTWPAPASPSEADTAAPSKPWTHRDLSRDFWQIGLGVRTSWVKDAGFDPYSSGDTLTHGSVFATRTLFVSSNLSIAAGLSFESGGRSSTARQAPSSLTVFRPGAIVEGRYHLDRDLYVGIKLVPQAVYSHLSMDETSSPASLVQTDWRFGLDTTGQVAWNLLRMLGAKPMVPEYWILGEFGYGFTQRKEVVLRPDVDDTDARSSDRLGMGKLGMSGVMMRVALAATF